jgi:hypothetical protein
MIAGQGFRDLIDEELGIGNDAALLPRDTPDKHWSPLVSIRADR